MTELLKDNHPDLEQNQVSGKGNPEQIPQGYTERMNRIAIRIMDTLDRGQQRLDSHYSVQRKHNRTDLRCIIQILIQSPAGTCESYHTWCRNISRSGLSFIFPQEIQDQKIIVSLSSEISYQSQIVRAREVEDGFWEYGVIFKDRVPM